MTMKKTILLIILMVALFSGQVFAIFVANESDIAYAQNTSKAIAGDSAGLRQLIIIAAGNVLESHAEILNLLNKVELADSSNPGYSDMLDILNRTISSMEASVSGYNQILSIASVTPYNTEIQLKLIDFKYSDLQHQNGISADLVLQITNQLKVGNVTEVYTILKADMESLIVKLKEIIPLLNETELPDVSGLWLINHGYSNLLGKGQYISEVFSNL